MPYRAPMNDITFLLEHVVGYPALRETSRFADATPDTTSAILTEAARLCQEVLAPLQRMGDKHPARLENGVVRTPPGFSEAFQHIADGGWLGIAASADYGGMGLPQTLAVVLNEMMSSACLAMQIGPLMSQGQIEALEHHASDTIKALYLPKLIAGEWAGTMNLTEPQAGSDVGALRTRAEPLGDGSYAITGQKIYISWGDHDMTPNICHLVLARLPDAPDGTRGISLFMVPKFIPEADGTLGARNTLRVVSLEHKLGLHGSPTAVMQYDGAKGWLVGAPNKGMAAMFTMMNNARVGVGMQGIGVAEAAYQHAMAYARDRKQGAVLRVGGSGAIIDHADVRRMLAQMRAEIFAIRAIALANSVAIDMATATAAPDWIARAALLTPITKAHGTDIGVEVASTGIQVHGGMGFIEETGAAQFLRDVRVTTIYEGTNGIQAMDLVGRKMMDGGDAAYRLLQDVQDCAEAARAVRPDLADPVWQAAEALRDTTEWLVAQGVEDRSAGAVAYLRAFARVLGAYFHLKAALAAPDDSTRLGLARVFVTRILPEYTGLLAQVRAGAAGLFTLSDDDLAAA
jgi:acyl-CoA dehydrogenase